MLVTDTHKDSCVKILFLLETAAPQQDELEIKANASVSGEFNYGKKCFCFSYLILGGTTPNIREIFEISHIQNEIKYLMWDYSEKKTQFLNISYKYTFRGQN